jgi:manganese/zinc/iron transport system substrate-binding protein
MRAYGLFALALLAWASLTSGCSQKGEASLGNAPIRVTATTGMVADTARRVGGERVDVTALMGPGVDPHLYKASEGDIARLAEADLILYNGLNLEGKMGEIFARMTASGKPTVAVSDGIPRELLLEPTGPAAAALGAGHHDPHIWFDVSLWSRTIPPVVDALARLDPDRRSEYEANGTAYRKELEALHGECKTQLATVPRQRRVLVTAHDAFGYFGRAYDVEVVGLQGISTASEYGLNDVQRVVETIVARRIKAVFVESSVPRRSIEAVMAGCEARGHTVQLGGTLFSDAMGEAGTPEGTYPGMVRHNVRTIVSALK